ncbi:serine protease [Mesorhizobium sp. M1B.F.Ca.ET.045.04.1.1]|uniref:S1 family peptidase n=1 Tax=Mesorhizobium sp. M1B.F.Ca.ET.045.04.1.1 TaxID=2493673 RepID=UPI000F74F0F5|nr:serine protease [Mesorhizobium sp. M1B.F.Ca.ET.045.04.1.1]AZO32415.1 trypsin-like serine protease [Mesorhizobium sp. M1B.F.Ca.ET.045.04.1.1]
MAGRGNVHFIRSTQVRAADVLVVAGKSLWLDCGTTFARIDQLCGDGASRLFSEPNVKEQDGGRLVVAWFGAFDDDAKQMETLDRGMRARVASALTARIEALRPALADQEIGETVAAMLNVADESSIMAVSDNAVLTNWGALPEEARASQAAFARHSERTIGPYLPFGLSPRVPGQAWTVGGASSGPARVAPAQLAKPTKPASTSGMPQVTAPSRPRRISPWPLLAVSLVFAACLIYAAWPGNLLYPEALQPPQPPSLVDNAEVNRNLQERIGKLKAELAKAACNADASVLGPKMLDPPKPAAAGQPSPPPSPGSPQALLASLDSATVLVLAPLSGNMLSTGSGFFVGQRDILTNNHVVEGAGDTVFVASKALGRAVPAHVVAKAAASASGDPDFALLRVDDAPSDVTALQLSTAIGRLDSVVAGGFPGFVMSMDKTYRDIINGKTDGIGNLEMVVTQGNVMAMPQDGATKVITHSANISRGNSGGPLSDACGRAVGVNTFIILDGENAQKLNFSLSARDAIQFLSSNGVTVTPTDKPCVPAPAPAAGQPKAAQ